MLIYLFTYLLTYYGWEVSCITERWLLTFITSPETVWLIREVESGGWGGGREGGMEVKKVSK